MSINKNHIFIFLLMCQSISGCLGQKTSVYHYNDEKNINMRHIQQWGDAPTSEDTNKVVNLGDISEWEYLTPYKVYDGQLNHTKFGYVNIVMFLTKVFSYANSGKLFTTFKVDVQSQFTPGIATPQSDTIHQKKYHNYYIDSSIYANSNHSSTSAIDYWPVRDSDLGFPTIIVTKNHSNSLSIGQSFSINSDASLQMKYDVFGIAADKGVKFGLNSQYTNAYSVTQTYQITDPSFVDMGYLSDDSIGEGAYVKLKDFSESNNTLKTGQKSITYRSGVLFDVLSDDHDFAYGDIMWQGNHHVRSKNIFGVFQFYTRLLYNFNLKFHYSVSVD